MLANLWKKIVRWRTWIVNIIFGVILTPEVILVIAGADWGAVVPKEWMPYIGLAMAVLNVWMRPRGAVLPDEVPEARKEGGDGSA
jgi:hypothetical protein